MTNSLPDYSVAEVPEAILWRDTHVGLPRRFAPILAHPPLKTLLLACALFFATLCTCLVAGTQFAGAYARNQAVSLDDFFASFAILFHYPAALLSGLPFAATLLGILLIHELGHFFACRYHHIRSSYPFFVPAPTLIGTFGAFILIRSPMRTSRALFDVGASGPIAGFIIAVPALAYGVLHAKVVPNLTDHADIVFGVPLLLHYFVGLLRHGVDAGSLLLHPVGRAAWVGLFATSLNLLPAGQLDGGHILRSLTPRGHRYISLAIPILLLAFGLFVLWTSHIWSVWLLWGCILLGLNFLRAVPVHDASPLGGGRRLLAVLAVIIFILCFMPTPITPL